MIALVTMIVAIQIEQQVKGGCIIMKILINGTKEYAISNASVRYNVSVDTSILTMTAPMIVGETNIYEALKNDLKSITSLLIVREESTSDFSEYNTIYRYDRKIDEKSDTISIILVNEKDADKSGLERK